jgi:S-(hydroxymethyl)glutathione dehydrogenase/alcohol dehydrogenase
MPRAAVCHRFGEPLSVERVTLDAPGRDEVRIRVTACAICHSDIAYASGAWGGTLPAVYGHEACGVVVEAGAGGPPAGTRVVVCLVRSCGGCARCTEGTPALCESRFRLDDESPIRLADGARAVQGLRCGAFADEVVVHASQAVAIPDGVPDASACLIACAVMTGMGAAANDAGITPGASVVVIGAGGVGLNAVQGAALAGAGQVIAVDVSAAKLAAAAAFGATGTVDASTADPVERVRGATPGGADAVIVTAGAAAARSCASACRRTASPPSSTPAPSPTTASASSAASWGRPSRPPTSPGSPPSTWTDACASTSSSPPPIRSSASTTRSRPCAVARRSAT